MSLVKWVQKYSLRDGPQPIETGPITFLPVIPLTALVEIVEGLKYIEDMLCERTLCGHFTPEEIRQETQRLLTSLEVMTNG